MNPQTVLVGGTSKIFHTNSDLSEVIPLFAKHFNSEKYEIGYKLNANFFIAFNHDSKLYKQFIKNGGSPKRTILIRLEPDSVFPAQYTKHITEKYGLIISPGSVRNEEGGNIKIGWPYQYHQNPATPSPEDPQLLNILSESGRSKLFSLDDWIKREHYLTMVAANKVSPTSKANYSLRRDLAFYAPKDILEVYGPMWSTSLFTKIKHRLAVFVASIKQGTWPNILEIYGNLFRIYRTSRGSITDKHSLLMNSKFSLVVENSNFLVTEKIFDAIINGAIPVYVGPDLEYFNLPKGIAIEFSGDPRKLLTTIQNIDVAEVEHRLEIMKKYIASPEFFIKWEASSVYNEIANVIKDYMDQEKLWN